MVLDQIGHPIQKLLQFLSGSDESHMIDKDAWIYLFFIEEHIKQLKEMASEIDMSFASDPE